MSQSFWDRYEGVSVHLDTFNNTEVTIPEEAKQAAKEPKPAPTIDSVVVETPGEEENRYWEYCLNTSRPLKMPQDPSSEDVLCPPWGKLDVDAIIKRRVPFSMVGSGLIYFNAARYSTEKFAGLLSMMEVKDIPKGEFVFFQEASEDPLRDGYLTQYRFVSREAYTKYHAVNMDGDKNPDKKKCRRSLFEQLGRVIKEEMKKYGKGKKVKPPKVVNEDGEEEEEEEEDEDEDDEIDAVAGGNNLNATMRIDGRGLNKGTWGLGFGFITESEHYKVYRLWSRPVYHPNPPLKLV
jgi:hypothetical protein